MPSARRLAYMCSRAPVSSPLRDIAHYSANALSKRPQAEAFPKAKVWHKHADAVQWFARTKRQVTSLAFAHPAESGFVISAKGSASPRRSHRASPLFQAKVKRDERSLIFFFSLWIVATGIHRAVQV